MMKVSGVKYEFSPTGEYWTIIGADDGMQFAASIPERIDGYPVLEIGEKAFYGSKTLSGIVLPRSINKIGKKAFSACRKLKYVSFANKTCTNLTIGEQAFWGCLELKRFQATDRKAFVQPMAFGDCEALHYVDFKVKTIGFQAFSECKDLDAIIFADKAKISSRCFVNCNVKYIAFDGDAIIADTSAFLKMFEDCTAYATEEFSYWDLAYEGLKIIPRQTNE